jgi:hypothetical protein
MKRTISEEMAAPAVAGETAPAVPEAARRPLRELMDDRLRRGAPWPAGESPSPDSIGHDLTTI